ncbi:LppP/LprE family lipoprotein [Helcobacillus massiliensis]|uniref:LppP/LprE family lipoprotein n=1 Tax=Helcobacillus massiliensis TaxID=521392 RepID=UPI0021A3D39A|nr:LppP/LprE family lipoprotein [Helcobacillus massiliensis]MCT1557620.1 LppP/LprE family lipoprotein [Helcobacillus massiliensis]MCT2035892.1 LppP/LprE family lipoprotein [Helcobacillus massiliensis]MCT2331838.1 LppP/LprE family lipoprotein [Helcobacillus massiliensis]
MTTRATRAVAAATAAVASAALIAGCGMIDQFSGSDPDASPTFTGKETAAQDSSPSASPSESPTADDSASPSETASESASATPSATPAESTSAAPSPTAAPSSAAPKPKAQNNQSAPAQQPAQQPSTNNPDPGPAGNGPAADGLDGAPAEVKRGFSKVKQPENGSFQGWLTNSHGYDPNLPLSYATLASDADAEFAASQIMLFHKGTYIGTTTGKAQTGWYRIDRNSPSSITVTYMEEDGRDYVSTYTWNDATNKIDFSGEVPYK